MKNVEKEKVVLSNINTILHGSKVHLRLITIDDCTEKYVNWLNDS